MGEDLASELGSNSKAQAPPVESCCAALSSRGSQAPLPRLWATGKQILTPHFPRANLHSPLLRLFSASPSLGSGLLSPPEGFQKGLFILSFKSFPFELPPPSQTFPELPFPSFLAPRVLPDPQRKPDVCPLVLNKVYPIHTGLRFLCSRSSCHIS